MPDVCQVRGCRGYLIHSGDYAYFRIPYDPNLRKQWLEFLKLPGNFSIVKSAKICSLHFEKKFIKKNKQRMRLYPSAVPTLFPPQDCWTHQNTKISSRKRHCKVDVPMDVIECYGIHDKDHFGDSCDKKSYPNIEFVKCSDLDSCSPGLHTNCYDIEVVDEFKPVVNNDSLII